MSVSFKVPSFAVGVLLLLQTLSACAPTAPQNDSTSTSSQQTSTSSQQASYREQIVLAIASNAKSEEGYDPTLGWGRYGSPLFQSTLLRRDENLKLANDLATNYTVSKNKKVWTVTIRNDAMFSDKTPLTAEDVAYTFNKAAQSGGLTDVTVLDKAVAIDDGTVELRLKQPQSTFVNRLVTLGIGIHSSWLNRYPHELSGGELQRIAVARVLNPATRYLIADEMTAMLDANTQALIWQAVLDYARKQDLGLLVISHEAALLKRLCHHVIDLSSPSNLPLPYRLGSRL